MIIRNEQTDDIPAIRHLLQVAFENQPHSNEREYALVDALRDANALGISLVAVNDDTVVGHIAFSKVTISGVFQGWFGLGPIAVLPEYQSQGIGSALIHEGLRILRERGAAGCVLLGEPSFYNRFGFRAYPELRLEGVLSEYFMALPFESRVPVGNVEYHPAFNEVA